VVLSVDMKMKSEKLKYVQVIKVGPSISFKHHILIQSWFCRYCYGFTWDYFSV